MSNSFDKLMKDFAPGLSELTPEEIAKISMRTYENMVRDQEKIISHITSALEGFEAYKTHMYRASDLIEIQEKKYGKHPDFAPCNQKVKKTVKGLRKAENE